MYFLKVVHHDVSAGYFTLDTAKYNPDNPKLYSILSKIDDSYKIDDYFTFLVYWDDPKAYNIWKQKLNPIDDEDNPSHNATGFQPIKSLAVSSSLDHCPWGGLTKSSTKETLLDGCIGDIWWVYSVGMTIDGWNWRNGLIPGSLSASKQVTLWVRVRSNINLEPATCAINYFCYHHLVFHAFILM